MTEKAPNRPPFKVSGNAEIKHLNVRKEGPEDDKILAVDVKLSIARNEAPAAPLAAGRLD